MDMVIFRTNFFELFSFLHIHVPYPPFRLLTNLGKHQDETNTVIRTADSNGTQNKHVILLKGLRQRLKLLHRILGNWREGRNNHRGYHPGVVLHDLLSHWHLLLRPWTFPTTKLHSVEIRPIDLKEIGRAIDSSSHSAEFLKEHRGPSHAPADMMQE